MKKLSVFFLHLLCISRLNAVLVQASQGVLNGTIQESRNGKKYSAFLGIPYAQPPTGKLRFKNPVPAENWNGIRQANSFGNVCPQISNGKIIGNEDCLFLNVYTAKILAFNSSTNSTLLPVMVWIHGGSFIEGSSNIYRANYLLEKDIVLVTMNYRLGVLGFFSLGNAAAPGNFGLKDQVLALKWVQKNIQSFGGDPGQVTLFGESAGGGSVGLHALSTASNDLFHQYIIQSGSPLCDWTYKNKSKFIEYAKKIAPLVSCTFNTSEIFLSCLRTRSVDNLLNTRSIFDEFSDFAQLWWSPTNEPEAEGTFLTDSPRNLVNQNQMKDLPLMTGQVIDEGLLNTANLYVNSSLYSFVTSNLDKITPYIAGDFLDSKNETEFTDAVKNFYFNNSTNQDEFIESLTRYIGDGYFLYPEVRMLEKVAPKINSAVYFYSFGYRGTISIYSSIENNRNLGVGHGDEVLYLFPFSSTSFGLPSLNFTNTEKFVSELMVDLWTSFSINGKPTSQKLENPDLWLPFNTENSMHLQIGDINNNTDPTVTLSNTYFTNRMNFWQENAPI